MMSPRDTSLVEEEGAEVDLADQDGVEREKELLNPTASTEIVPHYI